MSVLDTFRVDLKPLYVQLERAHLDGRYDGNLPRRIVHRGIRDTLPCSESENGSTMDGDGNGEHDPNPDDSSNSGTSDRSQSPSEIEEERREMMNESNEDSSLPTSRSVTPLQPQRICSRVRACNGPSNVVYCNGPPV